MKPTIKKLYSSYRTDKNKETQGVWKEYCNGGLRVKIGRAGGSNDKYRKAFQEAWKPYQRAADMGELSNEKAIALYYGVYADSIIYDVQFLDEDDQFKHGLGYAEDGAVVGVDKASLIGLFTDVPELFIDIKSDAENREHFLVQDIEAASKNS